MVGVGIGVLGVVVGRGLVQVWVVAASIVAYRRLHVR